MPKLKRSMLLIPLLTMSLLFPGNAVQAVSDNSDSNAVKSVSGNSEGDTKQSVSEKSVSDNKQAATDTVDSDVVRLICPTEYPFFIARQPDDEEAAAYLNSEIFHIANYSNKDILIDLSNIHLESGENASYNELSAPLEKGYVSETKDVFAFLKVMDIDPDNVPSLDKLNTGEIPPEGAAPSEGDFILTGDNKSTDYKVVLKASNYDEDGEFVSLQPESIFSFYIAGNVTPNRDVLWNAGDINIKVIINYSAVPSEDIETPDDAEESPESDSEDLPDADTKGAEDIDREKPSNNDAKISKDTGTEKPHAAGTEESPDAASLPDTESKGKDEVKDSENKDDKIKPDTKSNVDGIENK